IAVARVVNSEADMLLLDEPLAAMGAKEGSMILDLVARLKQEGRVSIIMILHNYVHVLEACDRVSMIQDGVIALDKPTAETALEGKVKERRGRIHGEVLPEKSPRGKPLRGSHRRVGNRPRKLPRGGVPTRRHALATSATARPSAASNKRSMSPKRRSPRSVAR